LDSIIDEFYSTKHRRMQLWYCNLFVFFFNFIYFKFELKLYFFLDKFIYISQWLLLKNNFEK
jgi:hypothetical protein